VWERAFEVAQAAQTATEATLLEQIITAAHKGGTGAIGLADTLSALQAGRAYQLLVDKTLHRSGHQCTNCRAVIVEDLAACPYCRGKLIATADVVNLAVHSAMDAGLKVSVLATNPLLTKAGGIAAVLRY
jgi:peptide subunit release factor 1 (eRF1)